MGAILGGGISQEVVSTKDILVVEEDEGSILCVVKVVAVALFLTRFSSTVCFVKNRRKQGTNKDAVNKRVLLLLMLLLHWNGVSIVSFSILYSRETSIRKAVLVVARSKSLYCSRCGPSNLKFEFLDIEKVQHPGSGRC